jgi:hypothetical protein
MSVQGVIDVSIVLVLSLPDKEGDETDSGEGDVVAERNGRGGSLSFGSSPWELDEMA